MRAAVARSIRTGLTALLATGAALALAACGDETPSGAPPPDPTGVVAARVAAKFFHPPTDRIPHELATNPGTPWGEYLGSRACQECHALEYGKWRDSFHSRTLYDAVPKTVFGDFSGKVAFEDKAYPFTARPYRSGDKMYVEIGLTPDWPVNVSRDTYHAGLPPQMAGRFEIVYSFGNRRHQPYVVRMKDGRAWVLPVFWNDAHKEWRYDGWRPYIGCGQCHVTGIKSRAPDWPEPDPRDLGMTHPNRWTLPPADEGWADGAVGCELCHGPGRGHVSAVRGMGNQAYRDYLAAGGKPTIYDPKHDTRERRMQQCDMCHNFNTESSVTWVPGPEGYSRDPVSVPLRPPAPGEHDNAGQFYEDGSDMSPCTVGKVFRASKMGRHVDGAGRHDVECSSCHDPHGNASWAELVEPIEHNELCLRCHASAFPDAAALVRHTRHKADSPGSMCVECHMPRDKRFTNGVQVMSDHIYSHAFSVPRGDEAPNGPPSACNVCHVDRDGAWVRETLRTWKAASEPPK